MFLKETLTETEQYNGQKKWSFMKRVRTTTLIDRRNAPDSQIHSEFVNAFKFEPGREKTGFLHMRKQRRRSASR